jgi:hypothetical protein
LAGNGERDAFHQIHGALERSNSGEVVLSAEAWKLVSKYCSAICLDNGDYKLFELLESAAEVISFSRNTQAILFFLFEVKHIHSLVTFHFFEATILMTMNGRKLLLSWKNICDGTLEKAFKIASIQGK